MNVCDPVIDIILCHRLDLPFFKWIIKYVRQNTPEESSAFA